MPESEQLCVCAEPLTSRGIYGCKHELCVECTLKKRVKMQDNACPYCRQVSESVYIVDQYCPDFSPNGKKFRKFNSGHLFIETAELLAEVKHILANTCPECDSEFRTYKELRTHITEAHHKVLCDLCTKHELNFSKDFTLISPNQGIREHLSTRHIRCKYCSKYFYSTAEFLKHCKQDHVSCFICERRDPEHPVYFQDYARLQKHYDAEHYMCTVDSCLEDKHIVFETLMELESHMVEAHKSMLSNRTISLQQLHQGPNNASNTELVSSPANSTSNNEPSAIERYDARLKLAAGNDPEKIEKINGANSTFLSNRVPVPIFIATYESVLSTATTSEITALLAAFRRAHEKELAITLLSPLALALSQRETDETLSAKASSNASKPAAPQFPKPVDVQRSGWAGQGRMIGNRVNIASLPRLGSDKQGKAKAAPSRPALGYAAIVSQKKPVQKNISGPVHIPYSPPVTRSSKVDLSSLPSLKPSSSKTKLAASAQLGPGLVARPENALNYSGITPTRPTASSPPPQPALSQGSKPVTSRMSNLNLKSLPTLPKKKPDEKKRTHNVIRIV